MKYAFIFAFVLACSFAAMVPNMAMTSLTSKFTQLSKATPAKPMVNEDVRFCGTYSTGCLSSPLFSTKADMTILGMMHQNPIYLQYPVSMFMGEQCTEEASMMTMTMNAPMKAKNSIEKTMVLTPEKITVIFKNEAIIASYKCTTPLELNVEYDVTTLDCKDEQGEDPFAETKAMIGQEMESPMSFGENDLVVKDDQGEETTFNRESDEGCTCALKKATTAMTSLAKAVPAKPIVNEDVRFCGTYSTGCVPTPFFSMQADMTILGMMHQNPIYLQYPVAVFAGEQCTEETAMVQMTMHAPLKAKNSVEKTIVVTPEKYMVIFKNEAAISGYKCTTPLELNVEYDIATLECKDEQGEDPFADTKAMIGKEMDSFMSFGENDLVVKDDQGTETTFNRESDEGCTCTKNLRA